MPNNQTQTKINHPNQTQTKLQWAKRAIRTFIKANWSDQKLLEVYAFNRDGKMKYDSVCRCIRGVSLCDTLHVSYCGESNNWSEGSDQQHHYNKTKELPGFEAAELAYHMLGTLGELSICPFDADNPIASVQRRHDWVSKNCLIPAGSGLNKEAGAFMRFEDGLRRLRLSPILRAEIRSRAKARLIAKQEKSKQANNAKLTQELALVLSQA